MDNAWLKEGPGLWTIAGLVIFNGVMIQKQIRDLRNDLSVLSASIKKSQEGDKHKP